MQIFNLSSIIKYWLNDNNIEYEWVGFDCIIIDGVKMISMSEVAIVCFKKYVVDVEHEPQLKPIETIELKPELVLSTASPTLFDELLQWLKT